MMVNKVILCICASCMALLPLAAQSVSGTVTDEKNLPLEEITVVALQAPDSLYITGGVTNGNGEFHIRISHSGKYMLKLSGIGFQTKYIAFSLSANQKKQLGSILLKEDAYLLSGVTVTAKKPEMELTSSSTVINLASSSLGSQGTLFDALKRLPGVQVKDDGTILLNGQSGATVMLNGKPTYLSGSNLATYLQAIPASSIGKIELISMPSSRYEASGKSGIIKVEMAKNNVQGFLVGFNSSYQQLDQYGKGNSNWMFQLRKNKLNISANYSYYEGTDINPTFIVRDHTDYSETPVMPVILNQVAHRTYNYGSHYARTRVDYDLSSRLSVGAYVSKNWTDRVRKERMNSVFTSVKAEPDSTLMTWNKNKLIQTNLQGGADYSYNVTSKLQWTGSVDFQSYRASDIQDQNSLYNDYWQGNYEQADTLRGKLRDNIDIVSTQSDVEFVLTKTLKLTGGVKASFVNIDNETNYSDRYNGAWTPKLNMNKDFQYEENIYAAYVQLQKKIAERANMEVGLRFEETHVKGQLHEYSSNKDSSFQKRYRNLFPYVSVDYNLSKTVKLNAAYGSRIVRPNYEDMNPFVTINDKYLYDQGNVELKPEISHQVETGLLFNNRYKVILFGAYTRHPICKSYLAGAGNRVWVYPLNMSSDYSYGIKMTAVNLHPTRWWTLVGNATVTYKKYAWIYDHKKQNNRVMTPLFYLGNYLKPADKWNAELNGYWNGKTPLGQGLISPMWSVSMAVSRSILHDKGTVRLFLNDILCSRYTRVRVINVEQPARYKERKEATIGISFSYKLQRGENIKSSAPQRESNESKRIKL